MRLKLTGKIMKVEVPQEPKVGAILLHSNKPQEEPQETRVEMDDRKVLDVQGTSVTIVRSGVLIEGEFSSPDDILIEGTVKGNVRANLVIVEDGAFILGAIDASVVMVRGRVEGEVNCTRLQVSTGGSVQGTICHSILVVEPGATIEGSVSRKKSSSYSRQDENRETSIGALIAVEAGR